MKMTSMSVYQLHGKVRTYSYSKAGFVWLNMTEIVISRQSFARVSSIELINFPVFHTKVKQSHYRPGQSQRVPRVRGSQISRKSAHELHKVVSLTRWSPLTRRKYSWYLFLLENVSTPGPLCAWKDYVNKKFQWHHGESNPRPSGLQHSASTNCTTAYTLLPTQFFICRH
jgi:hypothetical protein